MKINWKVRAKNPQWWLSVALAVVVPIGAYYGLTGSDVTSWGVFFDTLKERCSILMSALLFLQACGMPLSIPPQRASRTASRRFSTISLDAAI